MFFWVLRVEYASGVIRDVAPSVASYTTPTKARRAGEKVCHGVGIQYSFGKGRQI